MRKTTFLSLVLLFICPLIICAAETTTLVKVVEGEVYCFDYPEELREQVRRGEIEVGIFLQRVNEYTGEVRARKKRISCYLPYEFRYQIWEQLQPQAKVLLIKNNRRKYQTAWDVLSVGRTVTGGEEYLKGKVAKIVVKEKRELEEEAEEVREDKEKEEQETEEKIEEETNEEVLEEEGIEIEDLPPVDEEEEEVAPGEEEEEKEGEPGEEEEAEPGEEDEAEPGEEEEAEPGEEDEAEPGEEDEAEPGEEDEAEPGEEDEAEPGEEDEAEPGEEDEAEPGEEDEAEPGEEEAEPGEEEESTIEEEEVVVVEEDEEYISPLEEGDGGVSPVEGIDPIILPIPDTNNDTGEVHDEEIVGEGEGPVLEEVELAEEEEQPAPPPQPEPPPDPTPTPSGPTASISASPTSGPAPLTVTFDGSGSTDSDGTISSYSWDYGDSNTGTGASASYTYNTEGTYTATLTVVDNDGLSDTATVAISVGATPNTYYVWAGTGSDSNNGTTWAEAWGTIGYAVSQLASRSGNIDVYLMGTFNAASGENFPIMVSGGPTVRFIGEGASSTIIDGGNTSVLFDIGNSTHTAIFSQLGFQNGYNIDDDGGAFKVGNSTVSFDSCIMSNNQSTVAGGFLHGYDSSTIAIVDCTLSNNSAVIGGAFVISESSTLTDTYIYNSTTYTNSSTTFSSNSATQEAGGVAVSDGSTLSFSNGTFTFSQNTAPSMAAVESSASTITLMGATFSNNSATDGVSGAVEIAGSTGTISKCTFNNNQATQTGGAVSETNSTVHLINCLFYGNSSGGDGGAVWLTTSSPNIYQCTFSNNTSGSNQDNEVVMGLNSSPTIRNCLFNNDNGFVLVTLDATANPSVEHCLLYSDNGDALAFDVATQSTGVDDLVTWGWDSGDAGSATNTDADPQFKDEPAEDFRPTNPGSPCVDAGENLAVEGVTDDIQGTARPQGTDYDIGCFETVVGDPPITGRVYDSVTGELISRPTVAIYRKDSSAALSTTTSNPYTFNVEPGNYHISVAKSGYGFPSQMVSGVVLGDHGENFPAASDPLTINIPMDPGGWLVVTKTVNKKRVQNGEIVTYNVKIENKHWYEPVGNVELADEVVNGFKYVSGSSYRGSAKVADPVVSGRQAVFNIGNIAKRTTVNISYQFRVGTAIPPGRYKAAAHTRNSTTLSRNSNIDSASIEVTADPLFTRGTIIGKVFWDYNNNGIQDTNDEIRATSDEKGIAGVKIYTEYGVCVTTDEDGKYHIADVPAENHLLKVDPNTLPEGATFTTENPYFVKVTQGLLAKVNFGVSQEKAIDEEMVKGEQPSGVKNILDKFFIVALGEGTVSNLNTSGNIKMMDKDDRYDDGVRVDGRLAFYLKGKVLGKYLVKACVDTERLPGGRYRTKDLFTNLDPDKYYPVYGDASTVNYEGVDTQDVAFVLIEWDESFAKWGSFNTEMPFNIYERTLSGGIVNYVSVGETKFGDPWTMVKGFGAASRQKAAHDEFVGTGGSLYYLRHQDVIEGSEKLRIEVRDRVSKATLSSIPLAEEKDYEVDYDSGRILLRKPLNSVQQAYNSTIISNDLLMGERVYLIVDYEYLSEGLSDNTWGGRVSQQLGHHVRLGGAYVQEQKDGPNYEVYSGDATLKINEDTSINAFYGHSKETQLGSSTSYDGGLNFSDQQETFSNGKTGEGYSVNGRTKLFKNTDVYLSYSNYDPYFSITNSISQQGTEKIVGMVYSRLTQYLALGFNHVTSRIKKQSTPLTELGARDVHVTTGIADYRRGKWDLRGEYQHQTVKHPQTDYTYFGMLPLKDNDFVAARVGYQLFKWFHPYVRGQATLQGRTNNQGTVGADMVIWEKTRLNVAETIGNLGNSTLLGVTSKMTEGTDVYANLEVGNHIHLGKYARTTYGQSTSLSADSRVYVEEDYSSWQENLVRGTVLGYEEKVSETFALGLTYERSNFERRRDPEVINRDAGSVALTYLNPDEFWFGTRGVKGYSKVELRNDRGTTDVRQWVTENDLLWRLTEGLSVTGRGNWGWTEDRSTKRNEAEFYEVGSGFSLRPIDWDRLNILGKYSYLTNLPPDSQIDFVERTESRRHVYAIEGVFDVLKWLQLVGKVAYRDMKEKVGYRSWTHSDTYLYLGRVNFHLTRAWDLAAEYRTLRNKQIEDQKNGWLLEVDREIGRYIRLGVGYNFTDYDDDLRNEDKWDSKGWFVRVNGKY